MTTKERLLTLLDEASKIAGQTVHKTIHSFVKENHHFSSKDDSNNVPSLHELVVDYLLNHGVILPPVKVGDKVFMTTRKDILEMAITQIKVTANELIFDCADIVFDYEDFFFVGEIGKTVFLTREEAEAVIKKLGAEGKR